MKRNMRQALFMMLVATLSIGAVEAQPYEFQGHTYFLTSAGTWAEAEAEAVSHGGHLVSVDNSAEQDFINEMLSGRTANQDSHSEPTSEPRQPYLVRSETQRTTPANQDSHI